jgi:hypothetical protein
VFAVSDRLANEITKPASVLRSHAYQVCLDGEGKRLATFNGGARACGVGRAAVARRGGEDDIRRVGLERSQRRHFHRATPDDRAGGRLVQARAWPTRDSTRIRYVARR